MNKIFIIVPICLVAVFSCDRPKSSTNNKYSIPVEEAQIIRSVDSRDAKIILDEEEDIILLDVRTPEEYAEGHLAGAKNLDYNAPNFTEQIQQLDPDQKYMLYCAGGGRSGKSLEIMKEMGFKQVYNVTEGFTELIDKGIPVTEVDRE